MSRCVVSRVKYRCRCFRNGNVDLKKRKREKKKISLQLTESACRNIPRAGKGERGWGRGGRYTNSEKLLRTCPALVSVFQYFQRFTYLPAASLLPVILQNFVLRTSISYIAATQPRVLLLPPLLPPPGLQKAFFPLETRWSAAANVKFIMHYVLANIMTCSCPVIIYEKKKKEK